MLRWDRKRIFRIYNMQTTDKQGLKAERAANPRNKLKPLTKERKLKMRKFTVQEVIDMGAELYDNKGFDRATILK